MTLIYQVETGELTVFKIKTSSVGSKYDLISQMIENANVYGELANDLFSDDDIDNLNKIKSGEILNIPKEIINDENFTAFIKNPNYIKNLTMDEDSLRDLILDNNRESEKLFANIEEKCSDFVEKVEFNNGVTLKYTPIDETTTLKTENRILRIEGDKFDFFVLNSDLGTSSNPDIIIDYLIEEEGGDLGEDFKIKTYVKENFQKDD